MTKGTCAIPHCPDTEVCAAGDSTLCYPHFREMWNAIAAVGPNWGKRQEAMQRWLEAKFGPQSRPQAGGAR